MIRKWWIIWPLFAAIMGFALGGTYAAAFRLQISVASANPSYEKAEKATQNRPNKPDTQSALWIPSTPTEFFTAAVAVFTLALTVSTVMLWYSARDTARHQLRAYLHVEKVDPTGNFNDEATPIFKIRFKNYGQTPAHNVANICGVTLVLKGVPDTPTPETFRYADLGPSQDRTATYIPSDADWERARRCYDNGIGALYLVGEITYLDAFQTGECWTKPRSTKYCYLIHKAGRGGIVLTLAEEGNEST